MSPLSSRRPPRKSHGRQTHPNNKETFSVLDIDPNWSSQTLSSRQVNIIENIRFIRIELQG